MLSRLLWGFYQVKKELFPSFSSSVIDFMKLNAATPRLRYVEPDGRWVLTVAGPLLLLSM